MVAILHVAAHDIYGECVLCLYVCTPHLEPTVAFLPGQMEVCYEERRHHVSHVVVHPACQPQLPHGCVHQGVSCSTTLPGLQLATITAPPQSLRIPMNKRCFSQREMGFLLQMKKVKGRSTLPCYLCVTLKVNVNVLSRYL